MRTSGETGRVPIDPNKLTRKQTLLRHDDLRHPRRQLHGGAPSPDRSSGKKKSPTEKVVIDDSSLDNPDLGPFLLKLARDTIASGEGPSKALDYALRAAKSFERCAVDGEPSLDLAMSLHVVAAIYCSLVRFDEAIAVLETAIKVPEVSRGADHALAAFSGYMQLGDTYSMLGQRIGRLSLTRKG
ncbi:Protein KINESIN LIGHT CHAIN-RELATED 1 [Datura stramonium]|uniref:Protein KINESIN LIGHT CHAIN-RELATED 1 n=1 Tax=Datura stramonium TaxID=4076 RepID=A0ABS8SUQ3_DATST|nr:Protein KINESIN LIGHT CHAIN-RELATED 1 [Datura stramonium]